MIKIARAVHHAHQHGILHRDLKPENILFDTRGEPHVADFGLARILGSDRRLTHSRLVPGTPEYLAPERITSRDAPSTAADIWSLGVLLYQLLAGRLPFTAESPAAVIRKIVEEEPPPLRSGQLDNRFSKEDHGKNDERGAAPDRDLAAICLKCLEKAPADRYSSAAALAEDLERWLRHESIFARPVGARERAWKWVRRHPWKTAFGLALGWGITGPLTVALAYVLLINYLRALHHVAFFEDGVVELSIRDNRGTRITRNFDAGTFRGRPRTVVLEFLDVPDDLRSNLTVRLRCDWAGLPDPARSDLLRHGSRFTLSASHRRILADFHYYFTEEGWSASELISRMSNARIRLTTVSQP